MLCDNIKYSLMAFVTFLTVEEECSGGSDTQPYKGLLALSSSNRLGIAYAEYPLSCSSIVYTPIY